MLEPGSGASPHVSAASGLVRAGDRLYVVPDDEHHLAVFPAAGEAPGRLERLFEGELPCDPRERKRRKPDLECAVRLPAQGAHPHGALLVMGSCSKPSRCRGVLLDLAADGRLSGSRKAIDLRPLHDALASQFGRPNIEGAVALGGELQLLQRGNKGDRRNARIRLRLAQCVQSLLGHGRLDAHALVAIDEVDLGEVDGVPLCFSDGAGLADGRLAFTAIAEDTEDSYSDGPCRGAAIGLLGAEGSVERLEPIERGYKVEGIEAALDGDVVRALLVTDADDASVPASLLACELRA